MTLRGLPIRIGNPLRTSPDVLADRAIAIAAEFRRIESFALTMGVDRRLWVSHTSDINPQEWIATFTRGSDPDWLANEIEGVL